jgi:hypothetical protein
MPDDKIRGINVEDLLPAVCGQTSGERDAESPPFFSLFIPRVHFPDFHARQEKQEREVEIVPEGVGTEIQGIEVISPEPSPETVECLAWISSFREDRITLP